MYDDYQGFSIDKGARTQFTIVTEKNFIPRICLLLLTLIRLHWQKKGIMAHWPPQVRYKLYNNETRLFKTQKIN